MSKWIKKGDNVLIIAGNDKGKTGTVISREGDRVIVKGVNVRKKHAKSRDRSQPSSILEVERPVHISNTALCDDQGNKIYMKSRTLATGGKELYYLREDNEVVFRQLRKGS